MVPPLMICTIIDFNELKVTTKPPELQYQLIKSSIQLGSDLNMNININIYVIYDGNY